MKHTARYYTDYVFPVLYGKCGAEDSYSMMNRLKDRLTYFSDEIGERLMRVGEFKPSMFGNDNVMPTQAAEAARVFCYRRFENGVGIITGNCARSIEFYRAARQFSRENG